MKPYWQLNHFIYQNKSMGILLLVGNAPKSYIDLQ